MGRHRNGLVRNISERYWGVIDWFWEETEVKSSGE